MVNAIIKPHWVILISTFLTLGYFFPTSTNYAAVDLIEDSDIFIDVKVIHNTPMSTISEFSIDNGKVTGYFMEREAGTNKEEKTAFSKKRIPPDTYLFIKNDCNIYKNRPPHRKRKNCGIELRLKTKSKSKGITRDGVLIHIGNLSRDTSGCLLPGASYEINVKKSKVTMDRKTKRYYRNNETVDRVLGSRPKLIEITNYIDNRIAELEASGKKNIVMKIRLR